MLILQWPRFEFKATGLLLTTATTTLAEAIVKTKSFSKGVICSHWSMFRLWGREAWREWTLAFLEITQMMIILLRSSLDLVLPLRWEEIPLEKRMKIWLELEGATYFYFMKCFFLISILHFNYIYLYYYHESIFYHLPNEDTYEHLFKMILKATKTFKIISNIITWFILLVN